MTTASAYPSTAGARDAFILARRSVRLAHDPWRSHGVTAEQEPDASGSLAHVVTVFLTGGECPWRCAMCDLWKYTTVEDTPPGAIPRQIRDALRLDPSRIAQGGHTDGVGSPLARASGPRHLKLYNAGSFFDPHAVPPSDYRAIAGEVALFSRVIVESHPALIGPRVDELLDALETESAGEAPRLEVALGLETAHPDALERLNKRMTLDLFRHAVSELARRGVAVRAFLLVSPPFVPPREQMDWLRRSVDFAFDCGASAISLIPMREGNGTVEALAGEGLYQAPSLDALEEAIDAARDRAAGRVFADVWDLERLASCDSCFTARKARLATMNLTQRPVPRVCCPVCSLAETRV